MSETRTRLGLRDVARLLSISRSDSSTLYLLATTEQKMTRYCLTIQQLLFLAKTLIDQFLKIGNTRTTPQLKRFPP